ncbi:GNAT family N-acetyltransferase [Qipengyuania sp. XHP0207]|uniref:GNAT family N-acetyltransferase n=1 Tax=Qipengyuania sp. XHP0207 TaxID=3038078 RepID=UPI00241F4B55|nr:GNAT family N-acetyltransferase [Qipengyuania sp. XHP0207]MDG5747474.1 GNAT family N-acetyltransferase [Qipengyuania sp. XHP0207]
MEFGIASLADADVRDLVTLHQREMYDASPPGTSFALDLSGLDQPEVTVFAVRDHTGLLGIGALMALPETRGEIKSMRTRATALRRGVGQTLLDGIEAEARNRGYAKLFLETGTGEAFEAANRLFLCNGFTRRAAFGDYVETDFNIFYEKALQL